MNPIKNKCDNKKPKNVNKTSKSNLNQSKSQTASVPIKSSYNTRANPRLSFLNASLSSIKTSNNSVSSTDVHGQVCKNPSQVPVKSAINKSVPKPKNSPLVSKPNSSLVSSVINAPSSFKQSNTRVTPAKSLSKSLLNTKSTTSSRNNTPLVNKTCAASTSQPISKLPHSNDNQSSVNFSAPVSSVLSVIQIEVDGSLASKSPSFLHNHTLVDNLSSVPSQDGLSLQPTDQRLCHSNPIMDKTIDLTSQSDHRDVVKTSAVTHSADKYVPSKVAVFSDSMCRGVGKLLSHSLDNTQVSSVIKPGALFSQVTESIGSQCDEFGPTDYVLIQAGTNDILPLQPNCAKRLVIPMSLILLTNRTNVVICSIPYRYDKHAHLSTNIYETNNFLKYICAKFDFYYFDTNVFMSRSMYTEEGLHYNLRGKRVLASKLSALIEYRVSAIRKFITLTSATTKTCLLHTSPCVYSTTPSNITNSSNVQTIVSPACTALSTGSTNPTRTRVCSVGIQVRAYDIDSEFDSTFGSVCHDNVSVYPSHEDIINLSHENDDLLNSSNFSYPIPVISNNNVSPSRFNHSNFDIRAQTPTT